MRRIRAAAAVIVSLVSLASLVALAGVAAPGAGAAGPASTATVVLQCDRNTGATATVVLRPASGPDQGQVTIWCGSDSPTGAMRTRVVMPTAAAVVAADVSSFTGTFTGDCAGTVAVPATVHCPMDGSSGAKLVVR